MSSDVQRLTRRQFLQASSLPLLGLLPLGQSLAEQPKDDGWKKLFDGKSLDGWKKCDYVNSGKVLVKAGAIVLEPGNRLTGVVYSHGDFPKMDYEVTLEAKRVAGKDFFCTTTFPVGNSFCSFVVGGWGGSVVGLSSVDGIDASENDTNKSVEFKKDQWYRVRIKVTPKKIEAWIDKEQMVDLETKGRRISIRIECDPCRPFGVATWATTGAIRDVRVRKLSK